MARMVKSLMGMALVTALVLPVSGHAIQVNSPAPNSGFNLQSMLGQQLQGQAALNALSTANGLNLGNMQVADFGKMLATSMLQSALSGNFDPQSMFGNMANMMMVNALGGIQQQAGLGGLGQGLGQGGLGNFGGLGGNAGSFGLFGGAAGGGLQQALLGTVLQKGVEMFMGGIQGGSSSGGESIGGSSGGSSSGVTVADGYVFNPATGEYDPVGTTPAATGSTNYKSSDAPDLARNATVVESGVNYTSGYYDAMDGLTPDSRFQFVDDGAYDNNYWAGYQKGVAAAKATAAL
ncbi:MAG: hypothetical protein EON60_09025 [Alphaproteobacteria bacterium]|nr:MAG: hypothetical protein EON60_09025 [Alphaproteobacteria bacterium]